MDYQSLVSLYLLFTGVQFVFYILTAVFANWLNNRNKYLESDKMSPRIWVILLLSTSPISPLLMVGIMILDKKNRRKHNTLEILLHHKKGEALINSDNFPTK